MRRLLIFLPVMLIAILGGCARSQASNPFVRSNVALDPAVESNWPSNWATSSEANSIFASFVRFAEANKDWLLLGLKGEAVYVRAKNPQQISVRWQGRSNKAETLHIPGECEVLSLRQYARGKNLNYSASDAKLSMEKTNLRRNGRFR